MNIRVIAQKLNTLNKHEREREREQKITNFIQKQY